MPLDMPGPSHQRPITNQASSSTPIKIEPAALAILGRQGSTEQISDETNESYGRENRQLLPIEEQSCDVGSLDDATYGDGYMTGVTGDGSDTPVLDHGETTAHTVDVPPRAEVAGEGDIVDVNSDEDMVLDFSWCLSAAKEEIVADADDSAGAVQELHARPEVGHDADRAAGASCASQDADDEKAPTAADTQVTVPFLTRAKNTYAKYNDIDPRDVTVQMLERDGSTVDEWSYKDMKTDSRSPLGQQNRLYLLRPENAKHKATFDQLSNPMKEKWRRSFGSSMNLEFLKQSRSATSFRINKQGKRILMFTKKRIARELEDDDAAEWLQVL